MAQCILCKATIPDGTQYCENCYPKVKNKADESYLDNLLSSVTSSDDSHDNTKRRTVKTRKEHKDENKKNMNDDIFDGVPSDYNIFSKSEDDSDLDFLNDLFDNAIASAKENDDANSKALNLDEDSLPEVATTDELGTDDIQNDMAGMENEVQESEPEVEPIEEKTAQEIEPEIEPIEEETAKKIAPETEPIEETTQESEPESESIEEVTAQEVEPEIEPIEEKTVIESKPESKDQESLEEQLSQEDAALADSLLNDLMMGMDESQTEQAAAQEESTETEDFESQPVDEGNSDHIDSISDSDQDILDLINEINNTEELPPIEDVTNNGDKMDPDYDSVSDLQKKHNSDIGDVFSDALSAVSTLKDNEEEITDADLLSMIPDIGDGDLSSEMGNDDKNVIKPKDNAKKKRRGLFARIFGNIKEERTEEEVEQLKQQVIEEGEKKEADKKAKEEAAKQKKEQAKAKKAEDAKKAKEEAAKKKQEKQQQAKAKKEEKAQRSREIQELIDEIDENEGKINKIGAGIVFALFAAAAVFIVVGTNVYSYSVAIKNATNNFEIQHYNEAYKNVYGIDIKDEDIEIYDKIMTVMFVNKQLNSYENYYNMKKYPEALDSLLKGLERYDKYYSLAGLLGIESDLDYVRNEILDKLKTTFDVSLDEANTLLAYDDQTQYSQALYDLLASRVKVTVDSQGNKIKDTAKN